MGRSRVRGRRIAVVGVLCVAAAAVFGPAGQASVESCTYDSGTKTVSASVATGASATLVVSGGALHFGAAPSACGGATTANTDSIVVTGEPGSNETLTLDHRGGAFGPGATAESNIPEIEMSIGLGDTTDRVVIIGTEGDDYMAAGQNGLALNTDGDVDVVLTPSIFLLEVQLLGGADHFNGRGEGGAGLHFLGDITIYGGAGDDPYLRGSDQQDVIYGGPGNDILRGEIGNDLLDGGEGDDSLAAGAGNDTLIGGPGLDTFIGSSEDDVMYAEDDEADTSISGGPGVDTLYYDEQVDPAPVATEILYGDGGPPPPPPGPCTYNAATKSVSASMGAGEQATLVVVGGAIHFGSTPSACGDATTTNTDSIAITGLAGSSESLVLDLSGGAFAPGVASEGTGLAEIEISVGLGDATDSFVVVGSAGPDTIRMGQNGLVLNGDTDVDVTFAPLPAQVEIFGLGGPNTLTGTGGSGAGSSFTGKVILHAGDSGDLLSGGPGNDELYGGAGADTLEGNNGDDVLDGGAGNDNLKGGSGNDVLTGGAGADQFSGSSGTDTMYANDDEADVSINGGPDADTAYYDQGIDPVPVATENRIPA